MALTPDMLEVLNAARGNLTKYRGLARTGECTVYHIIPVIMLD